MTLWLTTERGISFRIDNVKSFDMGSEFWSGVGINGSYLTFGADRIVKAEVVN